MENKDKILKKVDELLELIKNSEEYKRYSLLSSDMEKNKSIMLLIGKIKKKEQEIVNKEYYKESTIKEEKEVELLKDELYSYPNYREYSYLQEDLNNMFQNIREILDKSINGNN